MAANLRVHHAKFGVLDSGSVPTLFAMQAGYRIAKRAVSTGSSDPTAFEVNESDSGQVLQLWVNPLIAGSPTASKEGNHAV